MFEVGFSEIALIAVVALLVLGPERLPGVARTVGALVRKARNSWQSVRTEIERELAADEMKRSIHDVKQSADLGAEMRAAAADIERSADPDRNSSHGGS